jgi:hypothetical protein
MGSPFGSLKISSAPMGSRIIATFETQGGWILFAHPTERITPNKIRRVHEKKSFIQSLYIPFSRIERRGLAHLLRPDKRVPLMSVPVFITGKEKLTCMLAPQRIDMVI